MSAKSLSRILLVLGLMLVLTPTPAASADSSITMVVEGEITGLFGGDGPAPPGFFQVGDHFVIAYTFDPATPDAAPEAWYGDYQGAITAVDVMVGAFSGNDSTVTGDIQVGDGFNEVDSYIAAANGLSLDMGEGLVLERFFLGLNESTGAALDSDAILTSAEQLQSLVDYNQVTFAFSAPQWGGLSGEATSIYVAPTAPIERTVARVQTASVRMRSAGECDFDEVHITETAGKVKTLGTRGWSPFADVVVELSRFRGCELATSYEGFSEIDPRFTPLRSSTLGPLSVDLVNQANPSDVIESRIRLVWTATGRPRPRVTHDGDFHRWDRFAPARVTGRVVVDGSPFFPGADVVEAEITRGIQFDTNQ